MDNPHSYEELSNALKEAKEQIAQYEVEISEFQTSSRELEKELELELEDAEKRQKELQSQVEKYKWESVEWKTKYLDLQKEASATQCSLLKEVNSLQKAHSEANQRLREMEMENDDMERHERITRSTLEEIEHKYHSCLEEIAMLEADVAGKDDLKTELQHTKDELRDAKEELQLSQEKLAKLLIERAATAPTVPAMPTGKENNIPTPASSILSPAKQTVPPSLPRLTSSKSLRKIHGMLDQMRNLESRVASFKSSLPTPRTPPSADYSRSNNSSPRSPLPESSSSGSSIPKFKGRGPNGSDYVPPLRLDSSRSHSSHSSHTQSSQTTRITHSSRTSHASQTSNSSYTPARTSSYSHQLEPIKGSPNMSPLPDRKQKDHQRNGSLSLYQRSGSISPQKSRELKEVRRPGSAFSALHNRPSLGHGRFV